MKISNVRLEILLVVWMVIGVACLNPFRAELGRTDTPTVGLLSISASTGYSPATVAPSGDLISLVTSYRVELQSVGALYDDITVDPYTAGTPIENIGLGEWNIDVRAFSGADLIAIGEVTSGTNPITITEGSNAVTIQLKPVNAGGTGVISFSLDWPPAEVSAVSATLDPWPGGTTPLVAGTDYTVDIGAGTFTMSRPTASGFYVLAVELSIGGQPHPPIVQVVHVYDNLTSAKSISLAAADFTQPPAAPTDLVVWMPDQSGVQLQWTDASNTEEGFEVLRNGVPLTPLPAGSTTYTDPMAVGGETYAYGVRSFNAFGMSTVAEHPPIVAISDVGIEYPPDGAVNQPLRLNFAWDPGFGAESLELYVHDGNALVVTQTGLPNYLGGYTLDATEELQRNTTYSWWLVARNASIEIETPSRTFTTRSADLYVDALSGIDSLQSGAGTTQPLASIAFAREIALADDTIHVTSGTYDAYITPIDSTITILGSYDDTSFATRSIANPGTVITHDGASGVSAITVAGGDVALGGVVLRAPTGTDATGITFSGGNLSIDNSVIAVPNTVTTEIQMRGVFVAGPGSIALRDSAMRLEGTTTTGGRQAWGFFVQGTHVVNIGIENTEFSTPSLLDASLLNWIWLQGGTAEQTVNISGSTFSGSVTDGISSVLGIGNVGSNTDITFTDNAVTAIENGTVDSHGIDLFGVRSAAIERNTFTMVSPPSGNLAAIRVTVEDTVGAVRPVINANRITLGGRVDAGAAYGVVVSHTGGTHGALVSNNVIEVVGGATMPNFGIESFAPSSLIVNNTFVADAAHDVPGSTFVLLNASATDVDVANNVFGSFGAALVPYNPTAPASTLFRNNLFWGTSFNDVDVNALNGGTGDANVWDANNPGLDPAFEYQASVTWPASTALIGGGTNALLADVPNDRFGALRADPVSIGAYEY